MFNTKKKLIEQLINEKDRLQQELEDKSKEIELNKRKIEELDSRNKYYSDIISEEQIENHNISIELRDKRKTLEDLKLEIDNQKKMYEKQIEEKKEELRNIKDKIVKTTDKYNMQTFGFYEPLLKDVNSELINIRIKSIREQQKDMIRKEEYYCCTTNWKVNESEAQGKRMVKKVAKNYITSFNLMCDAIIERVTVANIVKTKDKIKKTFDNINKQIDFYQMHLSKKYLDLKLEELELMYSFALKKEEEKEEKKRQAEIVREQKKVAQELKKQREKLEKELAHYLKQQSAGDNITIKQKIEEIKNKIQENDYRINNNLAGYVYIIENKSFEKGVYKIGVTRRLEPLDRISELSNASVPFRFQPNCIVFSDNAFKLENDLHKEFEEFRVNKVNKRKEYYKVPLNKIEDVMKNKYGIEAEFIYEPEHDEWTVSRDEIIGVNEDDDED